MRGLWIIGAATFGLVTASAVNAQQRLPRECRQEIRVLCGKDRTQLRECLRQKQVELSAKCYGELRKRAQERRGTGTDDANRTDPRKFDVISYGEHPRQAIDFHSPKTSEAAASPPPLVVFIHGGGWATGDRTRATHAKARHFTANGYAFASAGYRVLPDAPVEDQARDVAAAIVKLRKDAAQLGFDPDNIILMGHSAGAHLAALVATNPTYASDDFAAIRGVVLLDGAGYDVVSTMTARSAEASRFYSAAFGNDASRQAALSPMTHVGGDDAPSWLILHVLERKQSRIQSERLAAKLQSVGAKAEVVSVPDTDHGKLNRQLGIVGDMATEEVDAFIRALP